MDRKITPEQQQQKDRLEAARKEIRDALQHQCFLLSEKSVECWICGMKYIDGRFCNPVHAQGVRPVAPEKPKKQKKCRCKRDSDGECQKCKVAISDTISKLTDLIGRTLSDFKKITGEVEDPHCGACGMRYADWAIANGFKNAFGQFGTMAFARDLLGTLLKVLRQFGVQETPLMQKAWGDLCREKGWS